MDDKCRAFENELAESLDQELSAGARAHAEGCAACTGSRAKAAALRETLAHLKSRSAEEMSGIDLSAALLQDIERARPRPWLLRMALGAAIAAALLVLWRWQSAPERLHVAIDAPAGAQLQSAGALRELRGTNLRASLPLVLSTRAGQEAALRLASSAVELAPGTRLALSASGELQLAEGLIEIKSASKEPLSPIQLTAAALPTLSLRGHAILEHQPGNAPMQLLKRHKVIATSAVAALILYSGYATIHGSDSESESIKAPKGVYVDAEGKTHTFNPDKESAAGELLALANASGGTESEAGADDEFEPSGAFWSESEQVVQFRIRGEAFDADTGEPMDGFALRAEPIASADYAQRAPVQHSFSDLVEGRFLLGGLGLGTWRITASREGYAPVIQTLEIADLRATPYLVVPLSSSGAKLSGQVVDWRNRPVSGAQIGRAGCLEKESSEEAKAGCNLVSSDANGRFVLDKLPEEEVYALYAKHDRYGVATSRNLHSVLEEEGAGQHITIRLSGILRIYGRVLRGPEQRPVLDARVAGAGGETRTSASGDYELIVALEEHPEAHVVSYPGSSEKLAIHSYPADRSVRPLEWVDAQDYAAQLRIDFALEMSSATLVGTIRDARGKPQAGLEVQLMNTNGWKHQRGHQTFPTRATTDALGNYRVDNIPAEAGYMLRYRAEETQDWQTLGYVNIPEEREVRADFQVGSASIRGRFVNKETGAPMRVAQMSCSRLGAENVEAPGVFMLAHCYPDGRFEIVELVPGRYRLHSKTEWMASSISFEAETVELSAGQLLADVEIKVEGEDARLWRFRILSADNEFLSGAYIRYQVGNSSTTANLHTRDDGIAEQQLNDSVEEIFLEVPGYAPKALQLREEDSESVVEVHMQRLPESE